MPNEIHSPPILHMILACHQHSGERYRTNGPLVQRFKDGYKTETKELSFSSFSSIKYISTAKKVD